jgi:hypothetical protein
MHRTAVSGSGRRDPDHAGVELSSARLFELLRGSLAELLGTATTAILLRRAVRRAVADSPELRELVIARENREYRYALPSAWNDTGGTHRGLRNLVRELVTLLAALTGPLIVDYLARIPELRDRGIVSPLEQDSEPSFAGMY